MLRHQAATAIRPAVLLPRVLHPGSEASPRHETRSKKFPTGLHLTHPPTPDARWLPGLPAPEWRPVDGPSDFPFRPRSSSSVAGASCAPKGSTAEPPALPSSGRPRVQGLPVLLLSGSNHQDASAAEAPALQARACAPDGLRVAALDGMQSAPLHPGRRFPPTTDDYRCRSAKVRVQDPPVRPR